MGLGENTFYDCISLMEINIPDSVTSIGDHAFFRCKSLAKIIIPKSVISIGNYAFYGCKSLAEIVIPNSVTAIGKEAFYGCESLTKICIPASVTSIGDSAFNWCKSLVEITVDSKNSVYDSRENCNAIIETATGRLVQGCAATVIPASVTSIGDGAFWGCESLKEIYCFSTTPPEVKSLFGFGFGRGDVTVYVPRESVEMYRSADGWKEYEIRTM